MIVIYPMIVLNAVAPITPDQLPVIFMRGGETIRLEADFPHIDRSHRLMLRAYDQLWMPMTAPAMMPTTTPAAATATIEVPEVERLTVFTITVATQPFRKVGQIAAYPQQSRWTDRQEEKPVVIYGLDVPIWFRQWAHATSAPLIETDAKGLKRRVASSEMPALAVVGPKSAGHAWSDVSQLADGADINLLVLDADWFGPIHQKTIDVGPDQMQGRLAELRSQQWRRNLSFPDHREPWAGLINRQLWIEHDGVPLLEQVGPLVAERRIVLSYLPWARQLGQNDLADDLLEYVIRIVAEPRASAEKLLRPLRMLDDICRAADADPADRDVLEATTRSLSQDIEQVDAVRVVDLRGTKRVSDELLKGISIEAASVDEDHPLLILGDDRTLDECKGIELDRSKMKIIKPVGAVWLPDDVLPPCQTARIRTMITITDFGVPIEEPSKEKP